MEYYVHHVPGRLRVRIPEIRKNIKLAAEVKCLLDIYGVDHLKVNHLTGSVVATFDPERTSADQLLTLLKDKGLFDSSRAITCDDQIQRASNKVASKVGRAVFGYAVSKALESSGLPLLAALI
jgi:hypothetical protein